MIMCSVLAFWWKREKKEMHVVKEKALFRLKKNIMKAVYYLQKCIRQVKSVADV